MTGALHTDLRRLEGRMVHLALADGSRLDDVALVSARSRSVWVFVNGEDAFLPIDAIVDVWEAQPYRTAA